LPGDFKSVFSRVMSTKINRAQEIFYGTITGRILLCLIAISYVAWLFS
jgi:tetrahydromethanopterin S-methyltransferase subunit G